MDFSNLSVEQIENKFKTNKNTGLSKKKAFYYLNSFGKNVLVKKNKKGFFIKFLEQISDIMVVILLIAAGISFFSSYLEGKNDYIDSLIIAFIVIINATIGVFQEKRAEKAIDALKKLSDPKARVIRSGNEISIPTQEVVPGDVLSLLPGDYICADAKIESSSGLKVEESSLTGESLPVEKSASASSEKTTPALRAKNMLFASSSVVCGTAKAIVVATGMNTEVGKIANMINKLEVLKTPLQKNLEKIGKFLGVAATFICATVFVLGFLSRTPLMEIFMVSISLAVATIPEGLPAVVTIVLALGVRRMAKKRAIVKKLPAVEALGSVSVICSDKTGTLTQNKMTITVLTSTEKTVQLKSDEGLLLISLAALCNNAKIKKNFFKTSETGDQTELCILRELKNINIEKEKLEKTFPRIKEIPFDSKRKLMSTVHKIKNNKYRIVTKGAPDVLIPLCNLENKEKVLKFNEKIAASGLRVLAVSYKDIDHLPNNNKEIEKNLNFVGFIGMMDPPRKEVKNAVTCCKQAGIKPVMITGDQVKTATSIAKELGIIKNKYGVVTGEELESMTDTELFNNIYKYSIFARVSPEHKVKIVRAFQKRGEVVAMTGDGVNDAPALKASDIGCAMGLSGTDVAKAASDIIMTDDNFSTIVEAIRQGRGVYENIRKTAYFLLSSNIGEVLTILTSSLMKLPMPLFAIQLLWVNLITDTFPAVALGACPIEKNIMRRKPIKKYQGLFSNLAKYTMAIEGAFIGAISLLAFVSGKVFFDKGQEATTGRTMAFVVLSLSQVLHAFNVVSERSIFKCGILSNLKIIYSSILCFLLQFLVVVIPELRGIFKTVELNTFAWSICLALSVSPLLLVEIEKYIANHGLKNRLSV